MNDKTSNFNKLRDDLYCKYCGKQCKNLNSLLNHERLCKDNPTRQVQNHKGKNNPMYGKTAWNKGLTKESSDTIKQMSETFKLNYKLGKYKKPEISEEVEKVRREKLSKIAKTQNNFWKHRSKHLKEYNGYKFDSSYEIKVVKSLDENNIKWEKPNSFRYIDNCGIEHTYTPDIYLVDYDIYLDPKNDFLIENVNPNMGFKDIDKIKWVQEQNNIKIIILDKNHLLWENIQELMI